MFKQDFFLLYLYPLSWPPVHGRQFCFGSEFLWPTSLPPSNLRDGPAAPRQHSSVIGSEVSHEKFTRTLPARSLTFTGVKKCEIWPRLLIQVAFGERLFSKQNTTSEIQNTQRKRRWLLYTGVARGAVGAPAPLGGERNFRRNLQGKFVSAPQAHQVHAPRGRARVNFRTLLLGWGDLEI